MINVVHSGTFRAVAVSGEETRRDLLMDSETTFEQIQTEVARSEAWGEHYLFAAASRRPPQLEWGLTPEFTKLGGDDAWDPEDFLFALLADDTGTTIGFLSVDVPLTLRRPDADTVRRLDRFAVLVRDALGIALEREDLIRRLHEAQQLDGQDVTTLSTVSHELRNPLTALKWYAESLLQSSSLDPEAHQNALGIARNGERLHRLIEDLLVLSAAHASPDLPHAVASLAEALAEAVDVTSVAAAAAEVSLDIQQGPGDLRAALPQLELERALLNLLSNAVKFSSRGGTVHVQCGRREDSVWVSVRDEGIGMSPEDVRRLFRPFFRSNDPQTRATVGTGLGLAIVRATARRWGGDVAVQSEVAAGSTFTLWLRAADAPTLGEAPST